MNESLGKPHSRKISSLLLEWRSRIEDKVWSYTMENYCGEGERLKGKRFVFPLLEMQVGFSRVSWRETGLKLSPNTRGEEPSLFQLEYSLILVFITESWDGLEGTLQTSHSTPCHGQSDPNHLLVATAPSSPLGKGLAKGPSSC